MPKAVELVYCHLVLTFFFSYYLGWEPKTYFYLLLLGHMRLEKFDKNLL